MSNPSFENIDQWLFEYTEGNLSIQQESQLLDFISVNPELLQELKAWKSAKATPLTTHVPSTAALVKPAFLLQRPTLLVSIGIIALLLGWLGISYIPVSKQYTQSNIDTEIINVNIVNEGTFTRGTIASNQDKTNNAVNTSQKNIEYQPLAKVTESLNQQKSKIPYNESNSTSINKEIAIKSTEGENNKNDLSTNDYSELHDIQNQFQSKTEDLDDIIAYLNRDQFTHQDINSEEKIIVSRASVSSSTFKNSLNLMMRKIRRMVNQPTALRNTKDPYYHAPMMTGFAANPAMVGTAPGNRIQATSRIQWLNKPNAQLMNTLSWDGYVYSLRGGIGIDLNYDGYNINSLDNYSVGLTYSPKFSINKDLSFEPALRFKMGVVNIDQSSSLIGSQIEMNRSNITPLFVNETQLDASQMWYRDFGLGFMFNTKWFYAGFNADNLGRHNNNFYSSDLTKPHRDNVYYTAVIGTEYEAITRDMSISAYGLFQNYGDLKEIWLGANFQYRWMQFGAGVNTKADFGGSVGLVFNRVTFHYNVDYTESRLLNKKYLSHQVSLGILLKPSRLTAKYMNL